MDEDDYFEDAFEAPDPRAKMGCFAGQSANISRLAKV